MKQTLIVTTMVALLAVGTWYVWSAVWNKSSEETPHIAEIDEEDWEEIISAEYDFSFWYPFTGPDAYQVDEIVPEEGEITTLSYQYILTRADDYADYVDADEPREGPPTISISIFENPAKRTAQEWGSGFAEYASAGVRVGDIVPATVGGIDGVEYLADGLYMSDQILVTVGSWLYLFRGEWLAADDQIRRDFNDIVGSVRFIDENNSEN